VFGATERDMKKQFHWAPWELERAVPGSTVAWFRQGHEPERVRIDLWLLACGSKAAHVTRDDAERRLVLLQECNPHTLRSPS